jgi:hypothetical protein
MVEEDRCRGFLVALSGSVRKKTLPRLAWLIRSDHDIGNRPGRNDAEDVLDAGLNIPSNGAET